MAKNSKKARDEDLFTTSVVLRDVRVSPRKARLMVNLIKGRSVEEALEILKFDKKKSAGIVGKLLRSAVANVSESNAADIDDLWVTGGRVDMGRTLNRILPRARGVATPIRKRSSHITLEVGEKA